METIEADGRRGADAGAAGRVDCVDIGSFCDVAGCRSVDSSCQLQYLIRNDERQRGKLDSAFLLQHGKRLLEWFNNVSKGQGCHCSTYRKSHMPGGLPKTPGAKLQVFLSSED